MRLARYARGVWQTSAISARTQRPAVKAWRSGDAALLGVATERVRVDAAALSGACAKLDGAPKVWCPRGGAA